MTNSCCCAYCGETNATSFNKEHVIPRAFGVFYDDTGSEVLLVGRVCSRCNTAFNEQFEQRHTRESFDVFFRNKFLVKGRRPNDVKPNPYKKRKDGSRPLIVRGTPPGASHDVFFQMDSHVGASQSSAVHFFHPKTGDLIQIELHAEMSREELKQKLQDEGYENGMDLNLQCQRGDEEWFEKLFEKEKLKLGPPPDPWTIRAYVEGGYRKEDFRSIAKIGFNYMLKFNGSGLTGREACFDAVRAFIRDGTGSQFDFCSRPTLAKAQLAVSMPNHFLSIEATRESGVVAKIHLFATVEDDSPLHIVRLGSYPASMDLPNPLCSHRFQIESGPKDNGKVFQL